MTGRRDPRKKPDEILAIRDKIVRLLDQGVSKADVRDRLSLGKNIPTLYLEGTKYAHQKTR